MENGFCCFSGHRRVPPAVEPRLRQLLAQTVRELAEGGYGGFLCGGALGFDTLAAQAVLAERSRLPELTLSLALPCPGQSDRWPAADRRRYEAILRQADEVIYLSEAYTRFCMQARNRYMVDHSRLLVCYLTEQRGGTAATVTYALQRGLTVRNLAMELDIT